MSSSQTTDSPQVSLVREWIGGFTKKDMNILAKHLHKDYRCILYPRSLGKSQTPVVREEWLKRIGEWISLWVETDATFNSIIDAPGKVVTHISSGTKTSFGVDFSRELIMIFEIVTDDDGSLKILQLEEFVDSNTYLENARVIAAARPSE